MLLIAAKQCWCHFEAYECIFYLSQKKFAPFIIWLVNNKIEHSRTYGRPCKCCYVRSVLILLTCIFYFVRKLSILGLWTKCLPDPVICSWWSGKPWERLGTNIIVNIREREDYSIWFHIIKPRPKWWTLSPPKDSDWKHACGESPIRLISVSALISHRRISKWQIFMSCTQN